jgi:hypothetical protein
MENQQFELTFTWLKPVIGYEWEDCEAFEAAFPSKEETVPESPYLVEKDYSQEMNVYKPFEDSTLFANFGDIDPMMGAEAYLQWANKYGMLVGGEKLTEGRLCAIPKNSIAPQKTIHYYGISKKLKDGRSGYAQLSESLHFWCKEQRELRFALLLWELADNENVEDLKKVVEWSSDHAGVTIRFIERNSLSAIAHVVHLAHDEYWGFDHLFNAKEIRPWASRLCRYPDVIKPALLYLQVFINKKLQKYPLNFLMQIDDLGKTHNVLQPTSLLSAMWYQFSLALRGDIKIHRCDICGKWEDMKTHRATWHRHKTCASNQRVERFRQKDKETEQE